MGKSGDINNGYLKEGETAEYLNTGGKNLV